MFIKLNKCLRVRLILGRRQLGLHLAPRPQKAFCTFQIYANNSKTFYSVFLRFAALLLGIVFKIVFHVICVDELQSTCHILVSIVEEHFHMSLLSFQKVYVQVYSFIKTCSQANVDIVSSKVWLIKLLENHWIYFHDTRMTQSWTIWTEIFVKVTVCYCSCCLLGWCKDNMSGMENVEQHEQVDGNGPDNAEKSMPSSQEEVVFTSNISLLGNI